MSSKGPRNRVSIAVLLFCACISFAGCRAAAPRPLHVKDPLWTPPNVPRELNKVILPVYTIEPPDVLSIDLVKFEPDPAAEVPPERYDLGTVETIFLFVENTLPDAPIQGEYQIDPGRIVDLRPSYGKVSLEGLTTVEEGEAAIHEHLKAYLNTPIVMLKLGRNFPRQSPLLPQQQQIIGEHLVGPDGTVTLGSYGSVNVVGMTIAEAKAAVEAHLSQFLKEPEVSVAVFAYNSRVYYVVTQGAGLGDAVTRFPIMGNETVMDAISEVNGLTAVSSARIWIARPGKNAAGCDQILPVDWLGISQRGDVATNYQLLPGDRVYVAENRLVAFDQALAKLTAPLERLFGFTLLGTGTVTRLSGNVLAGGGDRRGFGGGF